MALSVRALGAAILALALGAAAPRAYAADPAVAQIDSFDSALVGVMKDGPALGPKGRARKLAPVIGQTFDIPAMTRFAVGPAWTGMSDADHTALIAAFQRYMTASYAHNFASYGGERFTVNPSPVVRGPDKIVQTELTPGHGDPINIAYRMRATTGSWRIIDVLFQGTISQLTLRRSDFAATVSSGGAAALIVHMDAQTDKLLK